MESEQPRDYRSEGHAPAPCHRNCDNAGEQLFIPGRDSPAPRSRSAPPPARSAARAAGAAASRCRGGSTRNEARSAKVTSAMPRRVGHSVIAGFLSNSSPAAMPTAAATTMLRRSGRLVRGDHRDAGGERGGDHRAVAQERDGHGDEGERRGEFQPPGGRHAGADQDAGEHRHLPGRPDHACRRRGSTRACLVVADARRSARAAGRRRCRR